MSSSKLAAHPQLERITTSGYRELSSWDLSVPRPSSVAIGPNPGAVTSLAYSPDGSLLAVGSGQILIRDAGTGKVQGRFSGPSGAGRVVRNGSHVDLVLAQDAVTADKLITAVAGA